MSGGDIKAERANKKEDFLNEKWRKKIYL